MSSSYLIVTGIEDDVLELLLFGESELTVHVSSKWSGRLSGYLLWCWCIHVFWRVENRHLEVWVARWRVRACGFCRCREIQAASAVPTHQKGPPTAACNGQRQTCYDFPSLVHKTRIPQMLEPALFIAYKLSRGKREDCRVSFLHQTLSPFSVRGSQSCL